MTSVTPETGELNTAPDSGAGEDNQAQQGQAKLDGQAEESRTDAGESEPNGQVERNQATSEQPDLIDLQDEKNGVDRGAPRPNGQVRKKSRAGDKEPNLVELSDADSRAHEESTEGRAAEAIPA